jgi:oligosaccharyltransferase complex subunit alpha (ribophorin I)
MKPFPAEVTQDEIQLFLYKDNHYFFSPYHSTTQETRIKLSSKKIESYSELIPSSVQDDNVFYGPYRSIEPFSISEMRLHYENPTHFLTFTKVIKEIEVSHWGNIAVEENFDLRHDGPRLSGAFSRLDLQRQGSPSAVHQLIQKLPLEARDVYFRDDIGNISSSNVFESSDGYIKFEMRPRYILFGGWQNSFYTGYNLPLENYLSVDAHDSTKFILNISFAQSFLQPITTDEITVRIILPEGADDIKFVIPFTVEDSHEKHHTYLDTTGRPVLILKKANINLAHDQYFQVTYNFGKFTMFREPLILIASFFVFFLAVMLYVRIDLSVTPEKKRQSPETIVPKLTKLKELHENRKVLYTQLEDAFLNPEKKNRDKKKEKEIQIKMAQCSKDIQEIGKELETLDSELGAKIKKLEGKEKDRLSYLEQINKLNATPKGKNQKEDFEERSKYINQYQELEEEIDQIVAELLEDL